VVRMPLPSRTFGPDERSRLTRRMSAATDALSFKLDHLRFGRPSLDDPYRRDLLSVGAAATFTGWSPPSLATLSGVNALPSPE
jgi:hypothetical protein